MLFPIKLCHLPKDIIRTNFLAETTASLLNAPSTAHLSQFTQQGRDTLSYRPLPPFSWSCISISNGPVSISVHVEAGLPQHLTPARPESKEHCLSSRSYWLLLHRAVCVATRGRWWKLKLRLLVSVEIHLALSDWKAKSRLTWPFPFHSPLSSTSMATRSTGNTEIPLGRAGVVHGR